MSFVNAELTIRVPDKPGLLGFAESIVDIKVNLDVSKLLPSTVSSAPAKGHSEEAWERIRPAFTASYLHGKKSIYEAKEEMATKLNFHASIKQFKYRAQKWNLNKNLPASHKEDLGLIALQCHKNQKPLPMYRSDGSCYPWHKVRRQDLTNGRRKAVWAALALPEAQRVTSGQSVLQFSAPKDAEAATMAAEMRAQSLSICPTTNVPAMHRVNEFLFDRITVFIPASATLQGMQDPIGTSPFFHCVRRIYTTLLDERGDMAVARAIFQETQHELQKVMRHPSALLLMELFHICSWRHWSKTLRLSNAMRYLAAMTLQLAKATLGESHPFTEILSSYGKPDLWQGHIWSCIRSELQKASDLPGHVISFAAHQVAHFKFLDGCFEEGVKVVETYKKTTADQFGEYSHWPRRLSLLMALESYEQRAMYAEARAAFEYAAGGDSTDLDEVKVRALRGLFKLYTNSRAFSDTEKSIELAHRVFEASSACHGPFDSATLWDLEDLRAILKRHDRQEDLMRLEVLRAVQREQEEVRMMKENAQIAVVS